MSIRISSLALLSLTTSAAAHAGTVLEMTDQSAGAQASQQQDSSVLTYAQDGKMRVEQKPGDSYMIFKDDTFYVISTRDKTYHAMDRAAMKRMAEQVNPALKQMQEQLAKMPPEQRAQVEQMMGGRMAGMMQEKKRELRKTTRNDKIAGYSCSYVEMYEDDVKTEEACVVPPASIKGSQELVAAAQKMSALLQEMLGSFDAPWLKQMIDQQSVNFAQLGGIPVLTRHYEGGRATHETLLKSIRAEAIPASAFDLPAGYTKKDMLAGR